MIGIVIVTHSRLGDAFIETVELIMGKKPDSLVAVSVNIAEEADKLRERIALGIKQIKSREGVLILTDMFGGTPSNLSYSFLEDGHVEVISGVNLPIVLKAINSRNRMKLAELAQSLESYGKKSITLASGILKGNKRN